MTALELMLFVCISALQFEAGFSQERFEVFYRSGQNISLPCGRTSLSTCSNVDWFYSRDLSPDRKEINNGKVDQSSPRAARMSLNSNCYLEINTITAEDAGRYICRPQSDRIDLDANVYLSILTVSPSASDTDSKTDENISLRCSLDRYTGLGRCPWDRLRWVDETGSVLTEGVEYKFIIQTKCVSVLTVKRQSEDNRRYTCQFVDEKNNVLVSADYTPDFNEIKLRQIYIIAGASVGALVLLVLIAVLIKIRSRKRHKETTEQKIEGVENPSNPTVEPESNLTYAILDHPKTGANKLKVQEAVTYSTVKTQVKTELDDDTVYSTVNN